MVISDFLKSGRQRDLLWLSTALFLSSLMSWQESFGKEPQSDNPIQIQTLTAWAAFLEKELDTAATHLENNAGSKAEVDEIQIELAKARHDLALVENDKPEIIRQCRLLNEIRLQQLKRAASLAQSGFGSELKLNTAMRRLACARYFLAQVDKTRFSTDKQLQLIVRLCNEELTQLTKRHSDGAASVMEVNRARHRATVAEHHLARTKTDSQSVIAKLRRSVKMSQQDSDEIGRLRKRGFAELTDEYYANNHLLNAKLLLANLERDRNVVLRELDNLIQLHRQTLPQLDTYRKGMIARLQIERNLARDQSRRSQYQRDGHLADDLSAAEIGS